MGQRNPKNERIVKELSLAGLPSLKDLLMAHDLWAKKSLGQNFLLDQNITDRIARHACIEGACVLEIGPGPGGLTRSLLRHGAARVIAIEKDSRCIRLLQSLVEASSQRLTVVESDAMRLDLFHAMESYGMTQPFCIVANLPYNIGTQILLNFYKQLDGIHSLTLMFQKEVADRIVALPKTKDYGRLSILSQFLCKSEIVFHLPPSAFTPPPKVTSAVVHFVPKMLSDQEKKLVPFLEKITQTTFGQRRKMLRSTLKTIFDDAMLNACGIDLNKRPEDLSVQDFVMLAQILSTSSSNTF